MAAVVLVIAGSLVHFWRSYREPIPAEYGWGDADSLELSLMLERTAVRAEGPLNYTAILKNTGPAKVRIFPWNWMMYTEYGWTNRTENNTLPFISLTFVSFIAGTGMQISHVSDREFNRMLVVLETNATYTWHGAMQNDSSWRNGWPLQPGPGWWVHVIYRFDYGRAYPALPVWSGTIESNWQRFDVLP
jgi:hypothetical protein